MFSLVGMRFSSASKLEGIMLLFENLNKLLIEIPFSIRFVTTSELHAASLLPSSIIKRFFVRETDFLIIFVSIGEIRLGQTISTGNSNSIRTSRTASSTS